MQRRFTKRLTGCGDLNYGDRLTKLGIDSLETWRLCFDYWSIWNYFWSIDTDAESFFMWCTNQTTRGHNMQLFVPQSRIDIHRYFFSRRVVQVPDVPKKWHPFGIWVFYPCWVHYLQFLFTYTSFSLNAWYQSKVSSVYRWTLQQDGAPSHIANNTINYLKRENVSFIEPQMWSPNSPDLNAVDYSVWGALQQQV